eukprot:57283-Hanusia_phi.AAC.1
MMGKDSAPLALIKMTSDCSERRKLKSGTVCAVRTRRRGGLEETIALLPQTGTWLRKSPGAGIQLYLATTSSS